MTAQKFEAAGLTAGALTTASAGTGDTHFDAIVGSLSIVTTGSSRAPGILFGATGTTAAQNRAQWNFTSTGVLTARYYDTLTTAFGATVGVFQLLTGGQTAQSARVERLNGGALVLRDAANTVLDTSPGVMPSTGTVRYTLTLATNGLLTCKAYDGDTATVLASVTGTVGTAHDALRIGMAAAVANLPAHIVDDVALDPASSTEFAAVAPTNSAPTATLIPSPTSGVRPGDTVTLSYTAADSDGSVASAVLTQTGGPAVTLSTVNSSTKSFVAPASGSGTNLTFQLVVTDNAGASTTVTTSVVVGAPTGILHWGGDGLSGGTLTPATVGAGDSPFDAVVGSPLVVVSGSSRAPGIQIGPTTTAAQQRTQWNFSPTTVMSARYYDTVPTALGATVSLFQLLTGGQSAQAARIERTSGGSLVFRDAANANPVTGVGTIPTTGVARYSLTLDGTTVVCKAYNGDTGTIYASVTGQITGNVDGLRMGMVAAVANLPAHVLDDFALDPTSATEWPSVVTVNQPPTGTLTPSAATGVEPGSIVTLAYSSADSDGAVASATVSQTGGPAVTLATVDASTKSFEAPYTLTGATLTFELDITDNAGANSAVTATVAVLAATERLVVTGGPNPVEVPLRRELVP